MLIFVHKEFIIMIQTKTAMMFGPDCMKLVKIQDTNT